VIRVDVPGAVAIDRQIGHPIAIEIADDGNVAAAAIRSIQRKRLGSRVGIRVDMVRGRTVDADAEQIAGRWRSQSRRGERAGAREHRAAP